MAISFSPILSRRSSPALRFSGAAKPSAQDKALIQRAVDVSQSSKDPSSKVGAVIVGQDNKVVSEDYNHFPPGIDEGPADRWERPAKYDFIGHAERNAIYAAARQGKALDGSRMAVNWFPCIDCAKAIISSGIRELVGFKPDYNDPRWGREFRFVKTLLDEAGIKLKLLSQEAFQADKTS